MKRVCTEGYFQTDYSTGFFKYMLIFKKQSNIDSLKIFFSLTLPFRLNSSRWTIHKLLTNFLLLTCNVNYMQLEISWTISPCYLRLIINTSYQIKSNKSNQTLHVLLHDLQSSDQSIIRQLHCNSCMRRWVVRKPYISQDHNQKAQSI